MTRGRLIGYRSSPELHLGAMLEQIAAAVAVLLIIPGWAVGLLALSIYLWRKLMRSPEDA